MCLKDKKCIEMQKEIADTNVSEISQKSQAEAAAEKEQWWEAALYPDPPYVSDR